jgi:hypothetical protein
MDGRLCRLSLLFAMHIWYKRDMYKSKVIVPNSKLELPHSLNEGSGFYVSDSSSELRALEVSLFKKSDRAYLYNTKVWFLARIIDRDFRDTVYPVLDSIRDMGYDLSSSPSGCHMC